MNIVEKLKDIIGNKSVFIYGYGTMGGTAHFTLHRLGYGVEGIVDSDKDKQGESVGGVSIISPYDLMYYDKDNVMVFVCSDRAKAEVIRVLESMDYIRDVNYSTFFLDGRSASLAEFNPQVGWGRGKDQFVSYDKSLDVKKTILTLGGSTTDHSLNGFLSWPQLLHDKIRKSPDFPLGGVKVINGGVAGYCSSHELLSLITYGLSELPDVLITYSGYNDSAGVLLYEYNDYHAVKTYNDIIRLASNNRDESDDILTMYFGEKVKNYALLWLKNARIIHGICNEFGIKHIQILQPSILTTNCLDEVERDICTNGPYKNIFTNVNNFYCEIKDKMKSFDWIVDFTNVFDDKSVYIDTCHVNEKGNEIVASAVYELLLGEVSK